MTKLKYSHKVIAFFLAINILQSVLPYNLLYASNNGPNSPEASSFESVNATDMVNLASGDMSYVLPLMDVGGLPISLSYHGGIPLDLESNWTGLGWNLNTGAINRGLNATPDDWNGGNSLDFIRYVDSEDIYTVNVGVGISKAVEVGVGASWGSNKSLSGSVFASVGLSDHFGASASIDTNGNYSLGVSAGTGKKGEDSFGGGIGISGNVNGGKTSIGVSAGIRTSGGMTAGVGASLDGGMSASLGYSGANGEGLEKRGAGSGGSLSTGSFSSGDWEISSKGWYIPIQIHFISFGFGKQKITYTLRKGYKKQGFGVLYSNINYANLNLDAIENENGVDNSFADYQNRYRYADAYEQTLPVPEKQFVGDYDSEREKLNFTYAGYDSYDVNATGISGLMQPKVMQNSTVYGLGYSGTDPLNRLGTSNSPGKMRVYWHNTLTTDKTIGSNSANNINFYFNGQFTQNVNSNGYLASSSNPLSSPLTPLYNSNTTLQGILSNRGVAQNPRLKSGNYVEVFTNKQIRNSQANGLLSPLDPNDSGLTLNPLQRNTSEYKDDGIGGYKITAPDGKVYHFSQPVYHYEMVERNVLKDNSEEHVSEKRQYSSYATHWLLTAITGPDFVDTNNNGIADSSDYGYWVRMDYGKWSDGYVWRTPTDKNLKDYTTNIEGNIGKKDFGTYQFGRKQLYYLDRVVSATHTAYFVKDLRYDSAGSDLSYSFNPSENLTNNGTNGNGSIVNPHEEGFTYKRQLQLMLKKIILVKNNDALVSKGDNSISSLNPLLLNTQLLSNYDKSYTLNFENGGGFAQEYGNNPTIKINNESGVYDIKDFEEFNYSNAVKVIDLEYNYNLAVRDHTNSLTSPDPNKSNGSPGTIRCAENPNSGKLCLKSVRFLGRNNFDYMPPYQFEYKGEFINNSLPYIKYPANAIIQKDSYKKGANGQYLHDNQGNLIPNNEIIPINNVRAKDEWGFIKDYEGQESQVLAAAWTMTSIKTPTGAAINFEHEEDDFYTEAFSRRYWTDNLKFTNYDDGNNIITVIENRNDLPAGLGVENFSKYFWKNQQVFLDLWLSRVRATLHWGSTHHDDGNLDINSANTSFVSDVGVNSVTITTEKLNGTLWGSEQNLVCNDWFSNCSAQCSSSGANVFDGLSRGQQATSGGCGAGCPDHWTMNYRLLANKVPQDETGGGLRVKSITLIDENNNKYKTSYYYNMPGTGKNKSDVNYKSSGITSYSPVRGQKFVPYQSELPSPGVMYEYVTMVAEDINGNDLGNTRYRFYTLKPVIDIFNENIEMKDDDGTTIFKATVQNHTANNGYLNQSKKINSKSVKLDVNTSLVGQFRSIEQYNKAGQLMSKTDKKYLSGYDLKQSGINRGSITESFQSMKSVYYANENDGQLTLQNRFLSISTKEEYGSVLQSIVTTGMHGKTSEKYSNTDPETGAFMTVETERPDGSKRRVERIAAYTKYPELGSKSTNPNNKHMLTQEAMNITSLLKTAPGGVLYLTATGGSITTWKKNWLYRDYTGVEAQEGPDVWRKHKTFILNAPLTSLNSNFATSNVNFDWNTGASLQNNLKDQWKKMSEITKYNHFSSPIEIKDINNNFASSKMADNNTKVIVSGNARYSEMYYSGAEYVANGNYFEGEVQGANHVSNDIGHTGDYSVKTNDPNDITFAVYGDSGDDNYYQSVNYDKTFRPGKYKVSVWSYNNIENCNECKKVSLDDLGGASEADNIENKVFSTDNGTVLLLNGVSIKVSEIVNAGCWKQYNFYLDIPENNTNAIELKNIFASQTNSVYFDDFRMHPISSSLNTFVYDHKTDELSYILDSNNMGSAFKYDDAGRLKAKYAEIENTSSLYGGFKITSQFKQKYKNSNDVASDAPTINNCLPSNVVYKEIQLKTDLEATSIYEIKTKTNVEGGSGNFSYQYKWLLDLENKTFSNYQVGSNEQLIPYAAKYCDENNFRKIYGMIIKVTDNITGKSVEDKYSFETDCNNNLKFKTDIQISKINNICGDGEYSFKIFPKNGKISNYVYQYANYNPKLSLNQYIFNYANGYFCPNWNIIEDPTSSTGFRKYVDLIYKMSDIDNPDNIEYSNVIFFGNEINREDIVDDDIVIPNEKVFKNHLEQKTNSVYKLDIKSRNIIEVYNLDEK